MEGWIKLHRKMLDNPIVCKDADYLAVWVYLLLKASHDNCNAVFKGKKIELTPGQLITGRLKIASELSVNESKVKRILNAFKDDQQIDQQSSNKNSLITILNWESYQKSDQQNEQPVTNKRPTTDQPVTTNKNVKNEKNVRIKDNTSSGTSADRSTGKDQSADTDDNHEYPYKEIVDYLNMKAGTSFRASARDTREHIRARMKEGYVLDDFKCVIDKKSTEWGRAPDPGEKDMRPYLRPKTLFGTKFESYLGQKEATAPPKNKFNNFHQRDNTEIFKQLEAMSGGVTYD